MEKNKQGAEKKQSFDLWKLTRPVFFVGFMGAGKSTIARRLARRLHIPSVDVDTLVERTARKKTSEIFEEEGEETFRVMEHQILEEVTELEPCFVSCGGGIVKLKSNRDLLKQAGYVIYLKVDVDEAVSRISNLATRPLLNDLDDARKLNKQRMALYHEVADLTLNTAGKTSGHVAALVQRILKKEGILCRQEK